MPARNGSMLMGNWIYSQFGGHLSDNFFSNSSKSRFWVVENSHCHHLGLARARLIAQLLDGVVNITLVVLHTSHHKFRHACEDLKLKT